MFEKINDLITETLYYFERFFVETSCGIFTGHDYRKRTDGTSQCIKCGRFQ